MSVTGCKIHETAFRDDVNLISVGQLIACDVLSCRLYIYSNLTKTSNIHLAVEMARIAADRAILHLEEMLLHDDSVATCNGHEDVTKLRSLLHLHHLESVHHSLHGLDRIHFGHDDLRTKTLCTHRNSLSAPSVTGYNDILACNDEVGSAVDSVPYRLACAVTIIEEMFAVSIVHKHHRELESLCIIELDEPEDACCGLLAASDHTWDEVCVFGMHEIHEVATVIDDDVRSHLEDSSDMGLILLWSSIIPSEHIQSSLDESRSHIILRRKRVASGHIHLGAASREHLTEICGLCFEMNRKSYFLSLEREGLTELFLESVEQRHMVSYPFYLESAVLPKLWISDFTCHVFCCFSIESAAKIGIFSHKRRHLTTITTF